MFCPKCGSDNVKIEMVAVGEKTKKKGNGLGGHLNNMARATVAISTLGMSNLVWKKSKGTNKTEVITEKTALCQNCGNDWVIK